MSGRDLAAAMSTAVQAGTVRPAILYEGEFSTGMLRLWTGLGDLVFDGDTYTGGGTLLNFSEIAEKAGIEAIGFSVTLSGMSAATVALALQEVRQGLPGSLWLALFDASGALIADPYLLQRGKFDIDVIDRGPDQCSITASYESQLIDLFRPRERRYTQEDQQLDYAGDVGFQYVPALQDAKLVWGGAGASGADVA